MARQTIDSSVIVDGAAVPKANVRAQLDNVDENFEEIYSTLGNGTSLLAATIFAFIDGVLSGTGFIARTAAGAWSTRTITGTSNEITVSEGAGGTGNPTLALATSIVLGAGRTLNISSGTLTLANDQISGDKVHGGTISSFASEGITDSATTKMLTVSDVGVTAATDAAKTSVPTTPYDQADEIVAISTGHTGIQILRPTNRNASIAFGNTSSATRALLRCSATNDIIQIFAGGSGQQTVDISGTEFVVNEDAASKAFRAEGNADANLIKTDTTNNRVGIGTASPSSKLSVAGTFDSSGIDDNATVTQVTLSDSGVALTNDLAVTEGGTGASTAAGARTNLGLGTAAVKNTGTSGDAVPLLNAANTWSLSQNIVTPDNTSANFTLREDGITQAVVGQIFFQGRDSAANNTTYTQLRCNVTDSTDTSEDALLEFYNMFGGTFARQGYIGGGLVWGNPTGGDKGVGTINAQAVYDDNVLLTCYVFDQYLDGKIDEVKWDMKVPDRVDDSGAVIEVRTHKDMRKFQSRIGTEYDPLDIDAYARHWQEKRHLSSLPNEAKFDPEIGMATGAWIQRLVETMEIQAIHIETLNQRVKSLTTRLDAMEKEHI